MGFDGMRLKPGKIGTEYRSEPSGGSGRRTKPARLKDTKYIYLVSSVDKVTLRAKDGAAWNRS